MKKLNNLKTVCYIATNEHTCLKGGEQIRQYLGRFVNTKTWCLSYLSEYTSELCSDIYVASSATTYKQIIDKLPAGSRILIANRTLEISNLDEVLALPFGTEALVVSTWEETAKEKVELLHSYGLDKKIALHPYWIGNNDYPKHIHIAIDTGKHYLPPSITRTVNVGVRIIDISTFMEIIIELGLPRDCINEISSKYIRAFINSGIKLFDLAVQSDNLKRRIEEILSTVDHAIIAINESGEVVLVNPVATKMLGLDAAAIVGKDVSAISSESAFRNALNCDAITNEKIVEIRGNHYVMKVNRMDKYSSFLVTVISLKPINEVHELSAMVRREIKKRGNSARYSFLDIIGESLSLHKVIDMAKIFAPTNMTVLLEGDSGTGKELFAQSIHNYSPRKNAPFVALNFAALPVNLVESELFGYCDGAFTGARKGGKVGLFEEAHGGTFFLDEIGDASLDVQKKLLRVIEEKEIRRVGGSSTTPIDVRIIAATNQHLEKLVSEGNFRQDLYYRLCAVRLVVPALQERKEDIANLLQYFADKYYKKYLLLDESLLNVLNSYKWPGNIRELLNVVHYICCLIKPGDAITIHHLPSYILEDIRKSQTQEEVNEYKNKVDDQVNILLLDFIERKEHEAVICILKELKQAHILNRGVGRQYLTKLLADRNICYQEYTTRKLLWKLHKAGCITVGSTRQGSKITPLGEKLYMKLTEKL